MATTTVWSTSRNTAVKRNGKACLDAFAWLAWRQGEPGAAAVQRWLNEADAARAECATSLINLGEAYYRLVGVERRDRPPWSFQARCPAG